MTNKREYNMDFLRILACFMVVMLHTSAQNWNTVPVTSFEWQALNFYNAMVRSSIAIFFMISGKLFLSKETLSIKHLFLKNILKLLFVYILWSVLYAIDTLGIIHLLNNFSLREFATIAIASKYHLWYLPELISVYLLIPILFALKNYQDGKILTYICILVFLFTILRASVLVFVDSALLIDLFGRVKFALGSCCGYFVLGYVLDKNKEKLSKIKTPLLLLLLATLIIMTAVGVYFDSAAKGAASHTFYNDIFLSNYLVAIILFVLFLRVPTGNISVRMRIWVQKLAKYTLFVYLIHPFVLEHLKSIFLVDTLSFNPWLSVPAITAAVFLASMCAARVIDMIPGIKKLLL